MVGMVITMVHLVIFINLFFIPLLPLYVIYRKKQKPLEPNLDLLFQYGIIAVCNIPLTKIFTFLSKKIGGIFISIDSGYYTVAALLPPVLLVLLCKLYKAYSDRKQRKVKPNTRERKEKITQMVEVENEKTDGHVQAKIKYVIHALPVLFVFVLLAAVINIGIPSLNKTWTYDDLDLYSSLVEGTTPRAVDGGDSGYLALGPYIKLAEGDYVARLYYSTNTDGNTVDVNINLKDLIYEEILSQWQHIHTIKLSFPENVDYLEIRTWYSGEGALSVEKLEIIEVRGDLAEAQRVLNFLLIALAGIYCGYLLSKIVRKKGYGPQYPWKLRLKKAAPVSLLVSFTLCVAGPIGLYTSNTSEFWFSITQMLPMVMLAFIVMTATIWIVLSLFPGKWFPRILAIVFGIGLAFYLQGNFLVQDYGLLNGSEIAWSSFTEWAVIDTLIWAVCILLPLLLLYLFGDKLEKIVNSASIFLVSVQIVSLAIMVFTAKNLSGNTNYMLTTENINTVSSDENIIVFILDAFEASFMDNILESDPEYQDVFSDFTYYRNTACYTAYTAYALPYIMTNIVFKGEVSYDDYLSLAFQYTPLYRELKKRNYDIDLYTHPSFIDKTQQEYVDNFFDKVPEISSQWQFLSSWGKLTAFRYVPHIFKNQFFMYSGVFDELITSSGGYESYAYDSVAPYFQLREPLNYEAEKNAFRLYHLHGTHQPYMLNENAEVVGATRTNLNQQIKGCFLVVSGYIQQLKEEGVYDNSTIFIMADHGTGREPENPLLMIKPKNEHKEFTISNAPVSYCDLLPTFLWILGEDGTQYGRTIFAINENEKRNRKFYGFSTAPNVTEYHSSRDAWDYDSWIEIGPALDNITVPQTMEFRRDYTLMMRDQGEMNFIFDEKPVGTIQMGLETYSAVEEDSTVVVYANQTEVFRGKVSSTNSSFEIPQDLVADTINLRFEFPESGDKRGHLAAFRFDA